MSALTLAVSPITQAPFIEALGHSSEGQPEAVRSNPFINRRWRCYRYLPASTDGSMAPQRFGPHYDGAQPLSVLKDGEVLDEAPPSGVVRLSQKTILLYLSDGHDGGETVFYPRGEARAEDAVKVEPHAGSALCFWHGHHPHSPLHEGAPLRGADSAKPKYVIRTEAMFVSEAPPKNANEWASSTYASAMARAMRM